MSHRLKLWLVIIILFERKVQTMYFYKIENQIINSKAPLSGFEEIIPNTTDAAGEKHVPVIEVSGNVVSVKVGSVEHPMLEAHFIQWILLETENGCQIRNLKPGEAPKAEFRVSSGEKVLAAYEYCNLHGLWKSEF